MAKTRRGTNDDVAGELRYQSEERFRLLVESVKDYAIFMLDLEGQVVSWNAGAEHITGYRADEVIGEPCALFYPPEARETHRPQHELEIAASEGRYESEGWRLAKGGERFWAQMTVTALRDSAGKLRGFAHIVRDLSERRRREQLLSQNEERLRALIAGVRDYAIFMLDTSGVVVSWNEGAERINGYHAEEIIGEHFSRFYPSEERERGAPQRALRVAEIEGHVEEEGWQRRKDGSRFWASAVMTALRDANGRLIGYSNIVRDLTERRAYDEELRQSEERFRLLIESVQDYAIYMLDPSGYVMSWNSGAQRLHGYGSEEMLGKHFSRLYPPEDISSGAPWRELEAARAHGRLDTEGQRVRRDGSSFAASVVIAPMQDAEGRLSGFSHITHDLTHPQQMRSLEESSRRMNEFLAILSHELRDPLAPIRHAVTLMQRHDLGDRALERARDVLDHQLVHLTRVVDDLLDVSRIVHGTIAIAREPVELSTAVARAIEMTAPLLQQREQTLHVAPFDATLAVSGDLVRLTQVIANLLDNAAKYTPPFGQVWLTVQRTDAEVEITVRDNGQGISAERLPTLFNFFLQAEHSRTHRDAGLGVGLGLVKRLVELHGGQITARSDGPGHGAAFTVRLPALAAARMSERALASATNHARLEAPDNSTGARAIRRILVVDDNVDSAMSLTMLLQSMGYETDSAHDGAEAIERAQRFNPDLVLLDIGLPRLNGYEVAQRLRALSKRPLLLIAVTGWAQDEDRERARLAGFDDHLVKPADMERLGEILQRGFDRA